MKKTIIFLILSFSIKLQAQKSYGGIPYSFQVNSTVPNLPNFVNLEEGVNTIDLPYLDNTMLNQYADSVSNANSLNKISLYGKEIQYDIDFISSASYQIMDSTKVWRLKIQSPSAFALQVFFSKFKLDISGSLFIYDQDKLNLIGAFDYRNSKDTLDGKDGKFGIAPFYGNNLIIEYNQSILSDFTPKIHINSFVHVFDESFYQILSNNKVSQTQKLDCEISVKCSLANTWQNESSSVAVIMCKVSDQYFGFGTGSMINNTSQDGTPYLITAGHIFKENDNTYSIYHVPDPDYLTHFFFIFKYETLACTTPNKITPYNFYYSVHGGQILACKNSFLDDYALVKLDAKKSDLASWGICYSGWNRNATVGASQMPITLIHHPAGKEKSISVSENSTMPIYSQYEQPVGPVADLNGKYYKTIWAIGSTESGSSGSPSYDNNHRLIGMLSGGDANCIDGQNNQFSDYIYRFSSAWADGNFAQWLAPNSSQLTLNSYCPPIPSTSSGGSTGGGTSDNPQVVEPSDVCYTVAYTVNGDNPENKILNVCADNIWLTPTSKLGCSQANSKWFYRVEIQDKLCSQISNQGAEAYKVYDGIFNNKCISTFLRLFVAIQECDANLNLIGPEYSQWFFIFDSDKTTLNEKDNFKTFNLNGYFSPQGYVVQEGKYYKIKIATYQVYNYPAWKEYSAYIKTFSTGTNLIQNQVLTRNEVGTNITINNTTVPLTAGLIKVVAENLIKIEHTTKIQTGRYYIQDLDCNNIKQFRTINPDSTISNNTKNNLVSNESNDFITKSDKNKDENSIKTNIVSVYPNPANKKTIISYKFIEQSKVNIELYNINGTLLNNLVTNQDAATGLYNMELSLVNLPDGIYLIKSNINSKCFTNKLIVSHYE